MDHNPYAPPRQLIGAPEVRPDVYVDGRYLVIRDKAVLPLRCVITNQPVSPTDRRGRTFEWAPSFRCVLRRRRCHLSYCVHRAHRIALYRRRSVFSLVAVFVGWSVLGIHVLWFFPLIPLAIGGFPVDRLAVKRAEDGHFWIAGCGEAFLRSCEDDQRPNNSSSLGSATTGQADG